MARLPSIRPGAGVYDRDAEFGINQLSANFSDLRQRTNPVRGKVGDGTGNIYAPGQKGIFLFRVPVPGHTNDKVLTFYAATDPDGVPLGKFVDGQDMLFSYSHDTAMGRWRVGLEQPHQYVAGTPPGGGGYGGGAGQPYSPTAGPYGNSGTLLGNVYVQTDTTSTATDGSQVVVTPTVTVTKGQVLYSRGGVINIADNTNLACLGTVIGIAATSGDSSNPIIYNQYGMLQNVTALAGLSVGSTVYLGSNGSIIPASDTTFPVAGSGSIVQPLGVVRPNNGLQVSMTTPTRTASSGGDPSTQTTGAGGPRIYNIDTSTSGQATIYWYGIAVPFVAYYVELDAGGQGYVTIGPTIVNPLQYTDTGTAGHSSRYRIRVFDGHTTLYSSAKTCIFT